jgi:hypothetical protein
VTAARFVSPTLDQILDFCAAEPIERVFLEDIARRGLGRFSALERGDALISLCHVGANVVPSGEGCSAFADATANGRARMIIGEEHAVAELWGDARRRMPRPRDDRPGQPVYVLESAPDAGETGLRPATLADLELLVPACAAAHREEIGIDPLRGDPATRTITFYIDGVQVAVIAGTATGMPGDSVAFWPGCCAASTGSGSIIFHSISWWSIY